MKFQRGQAVIVVILIIGVLLAGLVFYGWAREELANSNNARVEAAQIANEALISASKKVQQMYMNDAACDPDRLNIVLKKMPNLPATYGGSVRYAGAYPSRNPVTGAAITNTSAEKANLCTTATGCRQIAVEQDNRAYVITVGKVSALNKTAGWVDCPRDVTVRLRVSISGYSFYRRVTLLNLCSYNSCSGPDYSSASSSIAANTTATSLCGAVPIPSRKYGDIVGTGSVINIDDLRWARRYLDSGGGDVGITSYMEVGGATIPAGTNGSCAPGVAAALSNGQCLGRNCIPPFDLDRSGGNNEGDLVILEYYLRGFLSSLPVRNF